MKPKPPARDASPLDARPRASAARFDAAIQFAGALLVFYTAGQARPWMDADEGYFLRAAQLTADGAAPCRDFFFQQMPLFVYPYAAAVRVFGNAYSACCAVSLLFGAGLAAVTAAFFRKQSMSRAVGWVGWFLIVGHAGMLYWTPTVKNHAMPLFFGGLSIYAALLPTTTRRSAFVAAFICSFAALCCVGSRLPAAPLAAFAILARLALFISRTGRLHATAFVPGLLAGAIIPSALLARSIYPDSWVFWFDVFHFHTVRSGTAGAFGTLESIRTQASTVMKQGQYPMLAAMALSASIIAWRDRPRGAAVASMSLFMFGLAAAAAALLPAQTFTQYFLVPSLLFALATPQLWKRLLNNGSRRVARLTVAASLCVAYAALLANHQEESFAPQWSLKSVREVSSVLKSVTSPNDVVFSTWQGFTFLADRRDMAGNENFNARTVTNQPPQTQLSIDDIRRLHIAPNEELYAALARGEPKAIVIGFFANPFYRRVLAAVSPQSGKFIMDPATHWFALRPEILAHYRPVKIAPGPDSPNHAMKLKYTISVWVRK